MSETTRGVAFMFTVTVTERGEASEDVSFAQTEVTIGRVSGNDIVLRQGSVSKRHAKIVQKDGKFIVIDLESTNGTIVNGRKITAPQVIRETDKLVVGDYVLQVSASKVAEPAVRTSKMSPHPPAGSERPISGPSSPTSRPVIPVESAPIFTAEPASERIDPPRLPKLSITTPNTLAMRVPLELLRQNRSGPSRDAPLSLPLTVFTDGFAARHVESLTTVLDSLPSDDLPLDYPPAPTDQSRMERAVRAALSVQSGAETEELGELLVHELIGLGPIEYYLDDPSITEVHVSAHDRVFVRKGDAVEPAPLGWAGKATLSAAAARIVRGVDDPLGGSVRLPDGTRIEVVLPPASSSGPVLSIKKPLQRSTSLADLVEQGCLSEHMATALRVALENRGGMVISSTRAEDATRFLSALLREVDESKRIVAVETVPSLVLPQPSAVRLETVPAAIPSTLQRAVTLSPDVLAVDPFGGEMVVEWLMDVAASPSAFVATFSGRNPDDALSRLVLMGLQGEAADASAVRSQIADSLDLLVHVGRYEHKMVVRHVNDISGQDGGDVAQQIVFQSRMGPGGLEFAATGHVPRLFSSLMDSGVEFDTSIFNT